MPPQNAAPGRGLVWAGATAQSLQDQRLFTRGRQQGPACVPGLQKKDTSEAPSSEGGPCLPPKWPLGSGNLPRGLTDASQSEAYRSVQALGLRIYPCHS